MTNKTSPISVRFSRDELKTIARAAQKLNLSRSEFIRLRAFGVEASTNQSNRISQKQLLAQILGKLGHSSLPASLLELSGAAKRGHLILDEEVGDQLAMACADISEIRHLLLRALGLRPKKEKRGEK